MPWLPHLKENCGFRISLLPQKKALPGPYPLMLTGLRSSCRHVFRCRGRGKGGNAAVVKLLLCFAFLASKYFPMTTTPAQNLQERVTHNRPPIVDLASCRQVRAQAVTKRDVPGTGIRMNLSLGAHFDRVTTRGRSLKDAIARVEHIEAFPWPILLTRYRQMYVGAERAWNTAQGNVSSSPAFDLHSALQA